MRRIFTILLFGLLLLPALRPVQAQTDTEFWFAVPKLSQSHDWGNRRFFFRFASSNLPATITIDMPANPAFVPIVVDLVANAALTVPIPAVNPGDRFFQMWNANPDEIYNRGIRIVSTNLITAYFEVGTNNNPDIFALKGRNALGEDFFVPFQNANFNQPLAIRPYSGIYIAATEDNTEVTITPTRPVFPGRPAGVPFTIIMQRGQSVAIAPDNFDGVGNLPENHLGGTRVQSNKAIAVSTSDDSVRGLPGGCYDLIGDQIIPTTIIGTEYIAMRGRLTIPESFYVLATQPDTKVFIDEVEVANLQPGEMHRHEFTQQTHFIRTTEPSYVYHVAGFGCEQGGAVLPPINVCTGSTQVSFTRSLPLSANGENGRFFLNILVRAGAQDAFTFNGDGPNTKIKAADFQVVPGTTQWLAAEYEFSDIADVPVNAASLIENTKDVFHLAIINGGPGTGTMYGYFSDFNELNVQANISGTGALHKVCFGDPVQLVARGGTQYLWHPPDFLDDPTSATPIALPDKNMKYVVTVSGACQMVDSTSVFIELADPVVAAYTIDEPDGCSPYELIVTNESIGVSHYSWRMGDGTVYTTPAHEFHHPYVNSTDVPVNYEFMLVGRNTFFCRDTLRTNITVYPEITAVAGANIISGCAPLEVEFDNLSVGPEMSFSWKFGDGSSSIQEKPVHTFQNYSSKDTTYTVVLKALSKYGCVSEDTLYIHVKPYIETGFNVDPPTHCNPYPMELTNTSYGAVYNHWSFDDGATFEDIDDLQFTQPLENWGSDSLVYNIWLIGENDYGCADTLIRPITVYPEVKAEFSVDAVEGCNPLRVKFTDESTNPHTYLWDFDGAAGSTSEANPVVWFHNPSATDTLIYNVSLKVASKHLCEADTTIQIKVYPRIRANFTFDYTSYCTPQEVTFYNTSVGGLSYSWDFGNGVTSTDSSGEISQEFINNTPNEITYPIQLIIENASGCKDTVQREIVIYPEVKADFDVLASGCHPLVVDFDNKSWGAAKYYWDFGDEGTSQDPSPLDRIYNNTSHFDNETYNLRLIAESQFGCRDTLDRQIVVLPKPKADYGMSLEQGCAPLYVDFLESSLGASVFRWNFGDGSDEVISTGNVGHTYFNPGDIAELFNTRLIVTNAFGCKDTLLRNLSIFPEIEAGFSVSDVSGCHPLEVTLTNNSQGASATTPYNWNYGDGNSALVQEAVHGHVFHNFSHINSESFIIRLNAESTYGCKDSTDLTITVRPKPKANFQPLVSEGCSPFTVNFTDASIGASIYHWEFGDGFNGTQQGNTHHVFQQGHDQGQGEYITLLEVENAFGCTDTAQRQIIVYPDITAAFAATTEGCHPLQVNFENLSLGALQHTWTLGDGTISNEPDPQYVYFNESYTEIKTYTLNLHTLSTYGCEADITEVITVFPRPKSDFSLDQTFGCSPLEVGIENLSVGGSLYQWDLGGAASGEGQISFTHIFRNLEDEPVVLDLNLITTNQYGCSRESTQQLNVFPEVSAAFTADNAFMAGCSPLSLSFENLTQRAHQYQWSFGDGNASTALDPSNVFFTGSTQESAYNVHLHAQSVYGCQDSLTKEVLVYPVPVADLFVSPHSQVYPSTEILAENLSADGSWQYVWEMGDGTQIGRLDKSPVAHTYTWESGDYATRYYTVRLFAGNEFCNDTISQKVEILAPFPIVGFDPSEQGCPPLEVQFRNDTEYGKVFFWDFDDGNNSSEENPRHIFQDPGEYMVKLLVSGEGGVDSAYQTITVFELPTADFRVNPPVVQLPYESVQMVNLSSLASYYEWHMGDGQVYYDFEPEHKYETFGNYDITLIVGSDTNPQCFDEITKVGAAVAEENCQLIFPNAFTPNTTGPTGGRYVVNDPANNVFYPIHTGVREYRLEIYNRWGEFLYRSDDINIGWDGYYRGELSQMGVYVWKVWATCYSGKKIEDIGDVTLYR